MAAIPFEPQTGSIFKSRGGRRRLRPSIPIFACLLLAAGCGASSSEPTAVTTASTHYPVTIENCGKRITFDAAPTRAVTNDLTPTEDMVALGLTRSMVGMFKVAGDESITDPEPVPKQYLADLRSIREISPRDFTPETLARAVHPDFLFAGWWNYGLEPETNMKPEYLAKQGVKTLALSESCAQVQPHKRGVGIEDTYRDLTNLGMIFDVQPRAEAIIAQMKARVAAVQAKVSKLPPVSVFLYENDPSDPITALGLGTPTALIALAGGRNVFASIKRTWTDVKWPQLSRAKPQCIIIDDYSTPTWREKEAILKIHPTMRDVPAIHNGCMMHLYYDELAPGPRNAEAVEAIARKLHPQAFGLPSK